MKVNSKILTKTWDKFPYFGFGLIGGIQAFIGVILIILGIVDVLLFYNNPDNALVFLPDPDKWNLHKNLTAIDIPTWTGVWFMVTGSIAGCIGRGDRIITALRFTKMVFLGMSLTAAAILAPVCAVSSGYIVVLRRDLNKNPLELVIPLTITFLALAEMFFASLSTAVCCCCSDTRARKVHTLIDQDDIEVSLNPKTTERPISASSKSERHDDQTNRDTQTSPKKSIKVQKEPDVIPEIKTQQQIVNPNVQCTSSQSSCQTHCCQAVSHTGSHINYQQNHCMAHSMQTPCSCHIPPPFNNPHYPYQQNGYFGQPHVPYVLPQPHVPYTLPYRPSFIQDGANDVMLWDGPGSTPYRSVARVSRQSTPVQISDNQKISYGLKVRQASEVPSRANTPPISDDTTHFQKHKLQVIANADYYRSTGQHHTKSRPKSSQEELQNTRIINTVQTKPLLVRPRSVVSDPNMSHLDTFPSKSYESKTSAVNVAPQWDLDPHPIKAWKDDSRASSASNDSYTVLKNLAIPK